MASPIPLPATVQYAPDYPIVTDRLLLRPFRRGDVDAVYSYRSREDVAEYLFDPPMNHDECAEAVRVRTGEDATESDREVASLRAPEIVGELALVDGSPRSATVRARSASLRLLRIPGAAFRARLGLDGLGAARPACAGPRDGGDFKVHPGACRTGDGAREP